MAASSRVIAKSRTHFHSLLLSPVAWIVSTGFPDTGTCRAHHPIRDWPRSGSTGIARAGRQPRSREGRTCPEHTVSRHALRGTAIPFRPSLPKATPRRWLKKSLRARLCGTRRERPAQCEPCHWWEGHHGREPVPRAASAVRYALVSHGGFLQPQTRAPPSAPPHSGRRAGVSSATGCGRAAPSRFHVVPLGPDPFLRYNGAANPATCHWSLAGTRVSASLAVGCRSR